MRALLMVAALVIAGCGSSWQSVVQKSVGVTVATISGARNFTLKVCEPVLVKCIADNENPCLALDKCQAARTKALSSLRLSAEALRVVLKAAEAGDEKSSSKALSAATDAYRVAMAILKNAGVVK